MVNCPKCGRPVGGRARSCGFCGESLVEEYFSTSGSRASYEKPPARPGGIASAVIAGFGCFALLAALGIRLFWLARQTNNALPSLLWWTGSLALAILPMVLLMRLMFSGGRHPSLMGDAFWLFVSAAGLVFSTRFYFARGISGFDGSLMLPYLLVTGCVLVAVGSVAAILSCQRYC